MLVLQCQFRETPHEPLMGGIYIEEDDNTAYVICGCCGTIMEMKEFDYFETFNTWVDINNEIIGN